MRPQHRTEAQKSRLFFGGGWLGSAAVSTGPLNHLCVTPGCFYPAGILTPSCLELLCHLSRARFRILRMNLYATS
jgi:hypothetical protein